MERSIIRTFRWAGFDLTNITDGGDGALHAEESKENSAGAPW
jgi:hypothetical protein